MEDLFTRIVLGHLVGDYLFQSKKMALSKSSKGLKGMLWCISHSFLYTLSICLFIWNFDPLIVALIFMSHYPIDRWSLGEKWLQLIKGRSFKALYQLEESESKKIDLVFTCIVYTITDNTLHLILLWLITKVI